MSEIQFSSSVLVDDASTATSRFTTFSIKTADSAALESLRDEQEAVYSLSFAGRGLRKAHESLKAIESRGVLGGAPRSTMDNYFDAVCKGQGELVTVTLDVFSLGSTNDKEQIQRTGIITNVAWSAGPGGFASQRLDGVLYVCHRLHVRSGGTVTTLTDPSI